MQIENSFLNYFRENIMALLAVMMIALLLVGYLLFGGVVLWPQWQLRNEFANRVETAETALNQREMENATTSNQSPVIVATPDVGDAATFLTEQQAADFLTSLTTYAEASGVTITDIQAQPASNDQEKDVYDVRQFKLSLTGEVEQLMDFVVRVRETAVSSIQLTNLQITEGTPDKLVVDLQIYTSPYASGTALNELPEIVTPLLQPTAVPIVIAPADELAEELHELWTAEDWPAAISLIGQILTLDPDYPEMSEKLYAAFVNDGYALLEHGNETLAQSQFDQALAIFPDGSEALAGLQLLAGNESTSEPTTHAVGQGETLFSIARQHGVSVDQLRIANNLVGNNISVGQELLIP